MPFTRKWIKDVPIRHQAPAFDLLSWSGSPHRLYSSVSARKSRPGDRRRVGHAETVELIRAQLGLDKPIYVQYAIFISKSGEA
jgi:ABC-type dipeptide/oligopeptide/nickel transport system permease component